MDMIKIKVHQLQALNTTLQNFKNCKAPTGSKHASAQALLLADYLNKLNSAIYPIAFNYQQLAQKHDLAIKELANAADKTDHDAKVAELNAEHNKNLVELGDQDIELPALNRMLLSNLDLTIGDYAQLLLLDRQA